MSEYGATSPLPMTIEQRLAEQEQRDLEKQAQREAEQELIHTSKLAATDAAGEAHALISLVGEMRERGQIQDPALAARTAKDLAIVMGVMIDKGLLLEGRPTSITQSNPDDHWALVFRKMGGVIEGTATEIQQPALEP